VSWWDRARASLAAPGGSDSLRDPRAAAAASSGADGAAPAGDPPAQGRAATGGGGPVPREILRQVRLIELRTRGLVNTVFSGEYHSVFRGQGMEFAEVREYQAGDDVRNIDWNVTARMGHPFVKKHVEERELTLLLVVDLSGSEQFGTRGRFKAELAAEIAGVLALAAVRNNDRVGLLLFSDQVEHFVPPGKGRRHVLRLIRDVLAFEPSRTGTDMAGALEYAGRILPHRSIVFVLSDFLVPDAQAPLERTLRVIGRRHDLVAITITDPAEATLPAAGLLVLTDPETGVELAVDTSRPELRASYGRAHAARRAALRRLFARLGVDEVAVTTDESYIGPLLAFFRRRERKARR
jgi:uncharacterized protein (DUF58 family)